ncbi:hypothetical protein Mal64_22270 [Pseudobythopirellula maris]|uniref:Uncharacterized protein n=1 Tax=Pseudobythopirellula maris TaxID=2527991 RepID=A0A5C5ZMT5_9BACT|nr:hypothetical protein Mal64_22270 [Pseudobythopirellula maris]
MFVSKWNSNKDFIEVGDTVVNHRFKLGLLRLRESEFPLR